MSMSINEKLNIRKFLIKVFVLLLFLLSFPIGRIFAEEDFNAVTYFTGIGCPHCADVSPFLHKELQNGENFILLEYEIYKEKSNASILYDYANTYNNSIGIPLIIWDKNNYRAGDNSIINNFKQDLEKSSKETVLLSNKSVSWSDFSLNDLKGLPKIYSKDKILIKKEVNTKLTDEHDTLLKNFLIEDISSTINDLHGEFVTDRKVEYPGGSYEYENGLSLDGWEILWNGLPPVNANVDCDEVDVTEVQDENCKQEISLWKTIMLALTDSINPCALSVLTMMLIAIVTYHPKDKKQILLSGLVFVLAVFITYIIYGLLIVKAFQLLQSISTIKLFLYKGLGIAAIILGLLEIKDFFFYKPGSIGTEMPLGLRPKVQKIIARITSPAGAFGLGMFVTLFLLPCTIGPYVILGGILSIKSLWSTVPYLLLYNFVFVLPMIIIVLAVFFGTDRIKSVEKWRETNIKTIHLIIGLIFVVLGLIMITGIL